MKPDHSLDVANIDAYLDEASTPEERDQRLRRISLDGTLQAELALQVRIEESLSRIFIPPPLPQRLPLQIRSFGTLAPAMPFFRRRWFKVAALTTAATLVWCALAWNIFMSDATPPHYQPHLPLENIYEKLVADGFRPKWVCEDRREFANTFFARQGQGLLLAEMPAGTTMEGLTYCGGLSRYTTSMLARVDGQPVIVFVDRLSADTHPELPANETKLHLFRRELGPLVLYELTPHELPKVNEFLHLSEVPSK